MIRREKKNLLLFARHYEKQKEKVYNFALRMLNDEEKAADVVQNVFLKLFENLNLIRNEEKIPVWLFVTARNEIFAAYRERRKEFENLESGEIENINSRSDSNPFDEAEIKELREIIFRELENFSETNREVFLLREYGGLSYKEIAEVTGTEVSSVKSRLFKTRKRLISKISKII